MKRLSLFAILLLSLGLQVQGQDLKAAKQAVNDLGLTVSGAFLVTEGELTLAKNVAQFGVLKRDILQGSRTLAMMEKQYAQFEQQFTQAQQQDILLNEQLTNADPNNLFVYNQIVSAVNASQGKVQLMFQQHEKMDTQLDSQRDGLSKSREGLLQLILDSRQLVEATDQKYVELQAQPEVAPAIAAYSAAAKREYKLGPSATYAANVKKLADVEKGLESETIKLDDDGSGIFRVDVVVNAKHQQKMIVDSGASLVTLPYAMAEEIGIKVNEDEDEQISLTIANGDIIIGYPKIIPSLKVGKFEVKNVPCVVLESFATDAPTLLGMSFLGNFKFEIHAAEKTLSLLKLDESGK